MKLIVGLGNPGKEYENTRHNIGFMVLNYFPGNIDWQEKFNGKYFKTHINGVSVIFLKPQTYMNLSGDCVIQFVNYFKIKIEDILIIQDDLDLPFLNYRIKYKSSSGGHNGIKSIINRVGTDEIARLKIGIAHDRNIDTKDYVLSRFERDELEAFNLKCSTYKNIILDFITGNVQTVMMKYNGR